MQPWRRRLVHFKHLLSLFDVKHCSQESSSGTLHLSCCDPVIHIIKHKRGASELITKLWFILILGVKIAYRCELFEFHWFILHVMLICNLFKTQSEKLFQIKEVMFLKACHLNMSNFLLCFLLCTTHSRTVFYYIKALCKTCHRYVDLSCEWS